MPLGGVVVLPKNFQNLLVADRFGVKDHQHHFVVAGKARADLLVGGVRGVTGSIADSGGEDAILLPELALGSPKAAHAKHGCFHAFGEGRSQGGCR